MSCQILVGIFTLLGIAVGAFIAWLAVFGGRD